MIRSCAPCSQIVPAAVLLAPLAPRSTAITSRRVSRAPRTSRRSWAPRPRSAPDPAARPGSTTRASPTAARPSCARIAQDGRLVALEQRLNDENVAKIIPNTTRAEQVRDLFGPPYQVQHFEKMERDVWSWHMRRFGDPGIPVALSVQMSMDGVVREVYIIDESHPGSGFGVFGGGGGVGVGIGF
jgi:hypothetical protein